MSEPRWVWSSVRNWRKPLPSRKSARLEMTPDIASVFASKDDPPSPPSHRAEPRSAAIPSPQSPAPAPQLLQSGTDGARRNGKAVREGLPASATSRGVSTTVAIPLEVMERIHARLQQEKSHNMRSLILYALTQIGIEVEPEHLTPTRRRWTR